MASCPLPFPTNINHYHRNRIPQLICSCSAAATTSMTFGFSSSKINLHKSNSFTRNSRQGRCRAGCPQSEPPSKKHPPPSSDCSRNRALMGTRVMSVLHLYFPPKLLRRKTPTTVATIRYLSTANSRPLFSTLRSLSCRSTTAAESESSSLSSISSAVRTINPGYLSCSLPEKKPLKVAVLLSGGVDSSVALRLLHAAGHSCVAFYLKIWFQEDFENFWSECPWEEDLKYARAVCDQIMCVL